jgi:hypothetical protein
MTEQTTDKKASDFIVSKEDNPKIRKRKCIDLMKRTIEMIGPNSVNITQMERQFFFEWHTIRKWFNSLIDSVPQDKISTIAAKAEQSITDTLRDCERIIVDPNTPNDVKVAAIRAKNDALKTQASLLESYKRKEKASDKIELSGKVDMPEIIFSIPKELEGFIKKEEHKCSDDDPKVQQVQTDKKSE